ncbi:MAG: hypothetical protein K5644_01485, partial [Lachnospiraceae bacterium]|nr:hypothetical protein [Lachnospiraceae bacterium]
MRKDGSVIEPQLIRDNKNLEQYRHEFYPLFDELNFFSKNKPAFSDYNRIVVLGGTLNACNERTKCAKRFVTDNTKMIEGLSCYRP